MDAQSDSFMNLAALLSGAQVTNIVASIYFSCPIDDSVVLQHFL